MCTGAAVGEVVDYPAQVAELSGRLRPQVRTVRLTLARAEHLHWRFIGVQHALLQNLMAQYVDQRLKLHTAHAHPRAQRGSRYREARAAKDLFLAVQGEVVRIFADQYRRKQAGGRDALVDDACGHRGLDQRLALAAYPFTPDMPFHRKHARCVVQLLADVLADSHALAAAVTRRADRLMVDVGARQLWR